MKKQVAKVKSRWPHYEDVKIADFPVEWSELQAENYKDWFHGLLNAEKTLLCEQLKQMWYVLL